MGIRSSRALPAIMIAAAIAGPAGAASLEYNLFLHQGYRSFKVGDYFKARDYFTRAVDLHLRSAEARFGLAESLAALGQYQEAVIQMRHGIRLDEGWPDKDYPRFGLWPDQKTLDRHLEKLRLDVANFPKDANVRLILAYNLFHLGLFADAAELFVEAENVEGKKDAISRAYLSATKSRGIATASETPPPAAPATSATPLQVPTSGGATAPELPKVEGSGGPPDASAGPPPPPDAAGGPPPPPDAGASAAPPAPPAPPDVPSAAPPKPK